jgi:hypothetical protein
VADAAGTAETAVARISGYTLVLPGAWRRIPVQQGTRPAIRSVVDEVLRRFSKGVSRDNLTRYRIELERRLSDMAAQARSAGGADLYLPIEYTHGVTITASFVVSQVTLPEPPPGLPDAEQADTAQFVSYLTSADGGAAPAVIAGAAAARKESVAAADPAQQIPYGSRRVDYMLPVPGESRGMLVVAFSTIGDGDPEGQFAKLLVELFDAIMTTFRWAEDHVAQE